MRLLVINSGSSTLKFDLVEASTGPIPHNPQFTKFANGAVDRIGGDATIELHSTHPALKGFERRKASAADHREAAALALDALQAAAGTIDAVGHRVVHGGSRFVAPVLIDSLVIEAIEELCALAPLHNPAALDGIRATRDLLGPNVPMVAVFDTAFHSSLPEHAYTYALPYELAQRNMVRRYGFHGTAHECMLQGYARLKGVPLDAPRLVTLQLGNGCSAAAIRGGRSVDTSMGFTPLEGLVMGTRSGDLDPSIVAYLAEQESVTASDVDDWLNKRSGLLGISGSSNDMRTLLASIERGDRRAELAVEVFCYRVRKYVGAYIAALGGADAVVFGGGIGENAPAIRERILDSMEWCGIGLDSTRNDATRGVAGEISAQDSPVGAYVIPVDESLLIAEHTAELIGTK